MKDSVFESPAILTLEQVRFAWPGQARPVIDIADFSLARQERVFLRGPSGSGKTTLLSLIAAVIMPQCGKLIVDDVELMSLRGRHRDRFRADHLGLVFQQFNLLPYLSVAENVQLPCRFSARRRQQAQRDGRDLQQETTRLLQRLRLPADILQRPVMQLSVGQQQRVAVARALIGRPPLIIADEPTSALDRDAQQAFIHLLFEEVAVAGASLLYVSHDDTLADGFDRQIDLLQINAWVPGESLPKEQGVI